MDHPRPLSYLFLSFQYSWQNVHINFADDLIRTADLCFWKQPLCHLSHNHCPPTSSFALKTNLVPRFLVLRIWFQGGLFYKKMDNLQKIWPPCRPCLHKPPERVLVKSQKSTLTLLFALSNAFWNRMTQPGSTYNQGGDRLQGKGMYASPVLQGTGHWYYPTPKFAATSQISPVNFVQNRPSIQNIFMIFQNTERHTNEYHPCTLCRYGLKIIPNFIYLFTHGVS